MRNLVSRFAFGWMAALFALLAGCGGGSGSGGEAPTASNLTCIDPPEEVLTDLAAGVFVGTITGTPDENFVLVANDMGYDWTYPIARLIRWQGLGPLARPTGVTLFAGGYSCSSADRRAMNGKNWPDGLRVFVGLTSYEPASASISGTVRDVDGIQPTRAFSSGSIPGSSYKARAEPNLAAIAGRWSMTDNVGRRWQMSVAGDGKVAGDLLGCVITGTLQPSPDGMNLFSAFLAFTGACILANFPGLSGFAVAMPLDDGSAQLLLWSQADNGVDFDYLLAVGNR